jgi:hypothetical protein
MLVVTSGLGSSRDLLVWYEMVWDGFGVAYVEPYDP